MRPIGPDVLTPDDELDSQASDRLEARCATARRSIDRSIMPTPSVQNVDLLQLLRSLEEFLYEVMTWLIFYPRTMWLVLRHPSKMVDYSQHELKDAADDQYTDTITPPLFLMMTVVLCHALEVALHGNLQEPQSAMADRLLDSEQNLLILRSILFSIYPLIFSVGLLKRRGQPVERESLRAPFFGQCYLAGSFAVFISVSMLMLRAQSLQVILAGLIAGLASTIWYVWVESEWFKKGLNVSRWRALRIATRTFIKATFINGLFSIAVATLGK